MTTRDLVVEFLRNQGFCPEVMADGNVVFKYQMGTFLFINDEDDQDFFQLVMPGIFDFAEENRGLVLEVANQVNASKKVVKVSVGNDSVHLLTEVLLDQTPNVADIMPRLLGILTHARETFYSALR